MSPFDRLIRLPNDIGGLPAPKIDRIESQLEPWEKRCHALADVLDYQKIVNTEEKRRGVESLGAELVAALIYYERWIAALASILFQKGILKPSELAKRMREVEARTDACQRWEQRLHLSGLAGRVAERDSECR